MNQTEQSILSCSIQQMIYICLTTFVSFNIHPLTSSRHHPPAAAATTNLWLSFGFERPHRPNFELFWSAAAAAAGLGCLSRRVCAVKPNNVVNVFGRCRPVKTRRRLRVPRVGRGGGEVLQLPDQSLPHEAVELQVRAQPLPEQPQRQGGQPRHAGEGHTFTGDSLALSF